MSELREDITSGDWAIIAPGRAKRPEEFVKKKMVRHPAPRATCPFEFGRLAKSDQWPPLYPDAVRKSTDILVVLNKYPALSFTAEISRKDDFPGIYRVRNGIGAHELVITRDHLKSFGELDTAVAEKLFRIFQTRYRVLAADARIAYVSTFFNWGEWAGASVWHPHYQILGTPMVPPHVVRSLRGSKAYFKKYKRCVRCDMIRTETKEKVRVVAKNPHAIAFTPFASKHPFEVSIFPRMHMPSFGRTRKPIVRSVARLLQHILRQMKRNMHDPDYNVFIHGAPLDYQNYPYHHWHIEVLPKTTISAGFEFATDIDINVVAPEDAARILRK
jgi:UDPglucose--hexose-1-phosphate uridylyltransferase